MRYDFAALWLRLLFARAAWLACVGGLALVLRECALGVFLIASACLSIICDTLLLALLLHPFPPQHHVTSNNCMASASF